MILYDPNISLDLTLMFLGGLSLALDIQNLNRNPPTIRDSSCPRQPRRLGALTPLVSVLDTTRDLSTNSLRHNLLALGILRHHSFNQGSAYGLSDDARSLLSHERYRGVSRHPPNIEHLFLSHLQTLIKCFEITSLGLKLLYLVVDADLCRRHSHRLAYSGMFIR